MYDLYLHVQNLNYCTYGKNQKSLHFVPRFVIVIML